MKEEIACEDCGKKIPLSEIENGNATCDFTPDHYAFGFGVAEKYDWYCKDCK